MAKSKSILPGVIRYLKAHKTEFSAICAATGLRKSWMQKLSYGHIPDPGIRKIERLAAYIQGARQKKSPV